MLLSWIALVVPIHSNVYIANIRCRLTATAISTACQPWDSVSYIVSRRFLVMPPLGLWYLLRESIHGSRLVSLVIGLYGVGRVGTLGLGHSWIHHVEFYADFTLRELNQASSFSGKGSGLSRFASWSPICICTSPASFADRLPPNCNIDRFCCDI